MARYKYHTAPRALTAVSATSEEASFPKERLTSLLRLDRPWRSTDTTEQKIVIDMGSGLGAGTIILYRTNFTSFSLGHDTLSGGPFVAIAGSPFSVALDLKDGRYKRLVEIGSAIDRYLEITIPNQGTTDNNDFFQLGAILVTTTMTEIAANPQNPTDEERIQHALRAPIGADEEIAEVGLPLLQEKWQLQLGLQSEVNEWRTLRNLGADAPVVWWFNRSTNDVYVMRWIGGIAIKDSDFVSEVSATWRQVR